MKAKLDLLDNFPWMTNSLFWELSTEFISIANHPKALQHHICHKKNETSIFVFSVVTSFTTYWLSETAKAETSKSSFRHKLMLIYLQSYERLRKIKSFFPKSSDQNQVADSQRKGPHYFCPLEALFHKSSVLELFPEYKGSQCIFWQAY